MLRLVTGNARDRRVVPPDETGPGTLPYPNLRSVSRAASNSAAGPPSGPGAGA